MPLQCRRGDVDLRVGQAGSDNEVAAVMPLVLWWDACVHGVDLPPGRCRGTAWRGSQRLRTVPLWVSYSAKSARPERLPRQVFRNRRTSSARSHANSYRWSCAWPSSTQCTSTCVSVHRFAARRRAAAYVSRRLTSGLAPRTGDMGARTRGRGRRACGFRDARGGERSLAETAGGRRAWWLDAVRSSSW
jgi:hypothetical protein